MVFAPLGPDAAPPTPVSQGWRKSFQLVSRMVRQLRTAGWLAAYVRSRNVKAVVVQSPLEVVLAGIAARMTGIRAYWMIPNAVSANYPFDLNRRIYRFLFRHLNVVPIANSRHTDATLGPGDFERHVVHLGVDLAAFAPASALRGRRQELCLPRDAVVFGVFARMTPEKGQLELIEALTRLGTEGREIHLLLCGGPTDTPYARKLLSRTEELGLTQRVLVVGQTEDVVDYYAACDVVVSSYLGAEGFGLSVVEGMAMGKPVLAHRMGGPGETIIDGKTGWLISEPTPEGFASGFRRALSERTRWTEMSRAARDHVVTNFGNERMLDDLCGIIGSAAGSKLPKAHRVRVSAGHLRRVCARSQSEEHPREPMRSV